MSDENKISVRARDVKLSRRLSIANFKKRELVLDIVKKHIEKLARLQVDDVKLELGKYVEPKTNPQLAAFHGVIVPTLDDLSTDDGDVRGFDWWKADLKRQFLKPRPYTQKDGSVRLKIPSLADLSVEEMSDFIKKCLAFAWDFYGVEIRIDERKAQSKSRKDKHENYKGGSI